MAGFGCPPRQADKAPLGYLIAEGDSWFAYPGLDVLSALSKQKLPNKDYYKVYSAANPGDTIESMAYDGQQLEGFAREFRKISELAKQGDVRAILLSGGGNDIAGTEFHVLLNHAEANVSSPLDSAIADAFIDRIGRAMESLIGTAMFYADKILGRPDLPIVIHGYAPPVPDGRPYLFGWFLPGPWLQPGFRAKGYVRGGPNDLNNNANIMADVIRRLNVRYEAIPARLKGVADVRYVDVTKVLNNVVPGGVYMRDWSNELHPTDPGFIRVAEAIFAKIPKK